LGQDLNACLSDSPDVLLALFSEEVLDYFLVQKILSDALGDDAAAVYNFLLDPDAGLLVQCDIAIFEERFDFLFLHIGGQFGDELDGDDPILLILTFFKL
jgi:hypothetical protein